MNAGIGLTTYRRYETVGQIIDAIKDTKAADIPLFVCEDSPRIGVVGNRNRAIRHVLDAGCDWVVLIDDDVLPLKAGWVELLIAAAEESGQSHIARIPDDPWWTSRVEATAIREQFPSAEVWWSDEWSTDTVQASHRRCYETVGLYDESFEGFYGYDDVEWRWRLRAAGLVRPVGHPYVSPKDINPYLKDLDLPGTQVIERSEAFDKVMKRNAELLEERKREHARLYGRTG